MRLKAICFLDEYMQIMYNDVSKSMSLCINILFSIYRYIEFNEIVLTVSI